MDSTIHNIFRGKVDLSAFLGSEIRYEVDLDIGIRIKVPFPADRENFASGKLVEIGWRKEAWTLLHQ